MLALDLCLSLTYTEYMITTITGKNQVTLPAEIVRELELTPGTQLKWSIGRDGSLIATPQPKRAQRAAALHGAGRKFLPPGVDPVRDLIAERLQEDADAASADDEARP
jgi:antitoxin component of MazEF toxin-antitoxin module